MGSPIRILYIAGAARSGSTLLDRLLGSLPGFCTVGEARYFWEFRTRSDLRCGCGAPFRDCAFWAAVDRRLGMSDGTLKRMAALEERADRRRPLVATGLLHPNAELAAGIERLYRAMAAELPGRVLVDASKSPAHGLALSRLPDLELRLVHLVRDPRALAHSWWKRRKPQTLELAPGGTMPGRSPVRAVLSWTLQNRLALEVARRVQPSTRLRYEDLARDPETSLRRTLDALGFDAVDTSCVRATPFTPRLCHTVSGNPIRTDPRLTIAPDLEWQRALGPGTRLGLGLLAAPLLWRFGYPLQGGPVARVDPGR